MMINHGKEGDLCRTVILPAGNPKSEAMRTEKWGGVVLPVLGHAPEALTVKLHRSGWLTGRAFVLKTLQLFPQFFLGTKFSVVLLLSHLGFQILQQRREFQFRCFRDPVSEHHTVQMIIFMLNDSCRKSGQFHLEVLSIQIKCLNANAFSSGHRSKNFWQA